MKLGEISALPATELQRYLHDGSLSAEAVVNAVLAQIDRFDPELNAFALVDRDGVWVAADWHDSVPPRSYSAFFLPLIFSGLGAGDAVL